MDSSSMADTVVNVIPPSSSKRRGSSCSSRKSGGSNDSRRTKRAKTSKPNIDSPVFDKLNPKDPVHAKRLEQRRRTISKGKNTAGYDAYINQVPKEERRPRSMETPSTPDASLDIPQKRWNGQVKAWRRALHHYDPPDLMKTVEPTEMLLEQPARATPTPCKRRYVCFNDDDDDSSMESVQSDYGGKEDLDDFCAGGCASDSDDDIL